MRRSHLALLAACFAGLLAPAAASAAAVPTNATYTEEYFATKDGVMLHADVLRPKGLTAADKTPVVLTVSPYTNHSNQAATDLDPTAKGPSSRFYDLLEGAKLLDRGYTYVMVDLQGFGGSDGCNDWGGPGEQEDVRAAVRWAATRTWSSGKVALYGKSYDAWTGLMGLVQQPEGLAAVIAQEPVYDGYRYGYTHGVRFTNSAATPTLFSAIDAIPGTVNDSPQYLVSGTQKNPGCYALNIGQQQQDDEGSQFWRARELVTRAAGVRVPLFLTQGFLETNTKPDGAFAFFNALTGPKRAWFGQFDHVRGNDVVGGRLSMGRPDFFGEVNAFLDEHLKGAPKAELPPVVVQSSDGNWTAEQQWPPADATSAPLVGDLNGGVYTDDGNNEGTGTSGGQGIWTFSPPLPADARLSGVPHLSLDAAPTVPRANLVGNVYDVAPTGKATLVSRGATLLRQGGRVELDLYGNDWRFAAGHRIGVLLSGSNAEWWVHVPNMSDVSITGASISLPFRRAKTETPTPGTGNARLDGHLATGFVTVAAATIAAGTRPGFPTPAPRTDPVPAPPGGGGTPGADGVPGADGTNGTDGKNGADGSDGKNGGNGNDGANGSSGSNGASGADGQPGSAGANGVGQPGAPGAPGQTVIVTKTERVPARRCVSRRVLTVRVPRSLRKGATSVVLLVDGKRITTNRGRAVGRALRVDLRGSRRGTVRVTLVVRRPGLRTRRVERRFQTCAVGRR